MKSPFGPARPPSSEVGIRVGKTFTATGGSGPYTWALVSGALPAGVVLDATRGTIAGTPQTAGAFAFGVTATDSEGRVTTSAAALTVAPRLAIKTLRLKPAKVASPYQVKLATIGGVQPVKWSVVSGALPPGLKLSPTTGTIAGTPRQERKLPRDARGTRHARREVAEDARPARHELSTACGSPAPRSGRCARTGRARRRREGVRLTTPGDLATTSRARAGTYAGLFLVTLSTLMYEIVLTRIFSVTMWYHFAFVAISVALFGLTVGALVVYLFPRWFRDRDVGDRLWVFAALFATTLAICFVTQLAIPFDPELNVASAWSIFITCMVIAIPFVCSGVVVCLALTRFPSQTNRLYAADLVGAALGCILVVALFHRPRRPEPDDRRRGARGLGAFFFALDAGSRRGMTVALSVAAVLGCSSLLNGYLHSRGHPLLRVVWAKGEADPQHGYEKWNAFSRVTVDTYGDGPSRPNGVGLSTTMPDSLRAEEKVMRIDSNAATGLTRYTGDPAETDFLRYDISNLAHHALDDADCARDRRRRRPRRPLGARVRPATRSPASRSTRTS